MKIQIPQRKNITQRREGAKITQRRKKERFSSKPGTILSIPSFYGYIEIRIKTY